MSRKKHIPPIFFLTQYISDTQKNSKQRKYWKIRTNISKFRKFITLLPIFKKQKKNRKIRKFRTAERSEYWKR